MHLTKCTPWLKQRRGRMVRCDDEYMVPSRGWWHHYILTMYGSSAHAEFDWLVHLAISHSASAALLLIGLTWKYAVFSAQDLWSNVSRHTRQRQWQECVEWEKLISAVVLEAHSFAEMPDGIDSSYTCHIRLGTAAADTCCSSALPENTPYFLPIKHM